MRCVQLRGGVAGGDNGEEAGGGRVWGEQEHRVLGFDQGGDEGRGVRGPGQTRVGMVQGRHDEGAPDRHPLHLQNARPSPHNERGRAAAHRGRSLQIRLLQALVLE